MYPIILGALAILFLLAETISPWRTAQRRLRKRLTTDLIYFVFNGYFLGAIAYWLVWRTLLPAASSWLGLNLRGYHGPVASWPLWAQIIAAVLLLDFTQWSIHNLLHRVSWLWEFHKVHHSVNDGEMDLFAAFRFHWAEAIVYSVLQLPVLLFFGFSAWAVFAHSIVGTLWNYFNHANLNAGKGPWKYVFNSPRMHLWHHDANAPRPTNFGVIFSLWDYLFGTAYTPQDTPTRLGYNGDDELPKGALGQSLWPLSKLFTTTGAKHELRDQTRAQPHL